jgi:hypothetical protein
MNARRFSFQCAVEHQHGPIAQRRCRPSIRKFPHEGREGNQSHEEPRSVAHRPVQHRSRFFVALILRVILAETCGLALARVRETSVPHQSQGGEPSPVVTH